MQRRQAESRAGGYGWDASPISVPRMFIAETYALVKNDDFSLVSTIGGVPKQMAATAVGSRKYPSLPTATRAPTASATGCRPRSVPQSLRAIKGRYAVNFQGDGDCLVAPGSLWTAAHHKIPLLTIMHNNRAWHQEAMHLQRMADRRERQPEHARVGTLIENPNIDYAKMAQSFGVYARQARSPSRAARPAQSPAHSKS